MFLKSRIPRAGFGGLDGSFGISITSLSLQRKELRLNVRWPFRQNIVVVSDKFSSNPCVRGSVLPKTCLPGTCGGFAAPDVTQCTATKLVFFPLSCGGRVRHCIRCDTDFIEQDSNPFLTNRIPPVPWVLSACFLRWKW